MNTSHQGKQIFLTVTVVIVALFISPIAVNAASTGNTQLTLTINATTGTNGGGGNNGYLSITAPASLNLGSNIAFPASYVVTSGLVAVTDTRNTSVGWTSAVIMSALTSSTPGVPLIPASIFSYDPGALSVSGSGSSVGARSTNAGILSSVVTAIGYHTDASWTPSIGLTYTSTPVDGTYQGTMTSSVY